MNLRDLLSRIPEVQREQARQDFAPHSKVELGSWDRLEEASVWCHTRWQQHEKKYLRRVNAAECRATFEFETLVDTVAFRLIFG